MGTLLFGDDDNIDCIQNIQAKSDGGESLCLAHRTTLHFFGAGLYLTDNGYVLRPQNDHKHYYSLTPKQIEAMQAEGSLPKPLPAYEVSLFQYAIGYSLWIVLLGCVVAWGIGKYRRQRREAQDAATATSFGPPTLVTKADKYVDGEVRALLLPGETVMHQAYTLDRVPTGTMADAQMQAAYVALTSRRRLVFVKARNGAFGPLLENKGTEILEAEHVAGIAVDDRAVAVTLVDGSLRVLWVSPTRKLANQRAFLRDVPRILRGDQPAVAPAVAPSAAPA